VILVSSRSLVPFAVIVVVPFAELALPVRLIRFLVVLPSVTAALFMCVHRPFDSCHPVQFILKFAPNLLPTTFQDKRKKDENLKRELQARMKLASFLQDTLEEMYADHNLC